MGISSDLQKVIVARLREAVPSVAGRVYDGPAETATMPYIALGGSQVLNDDAECIDAREEYVTIHVWSPSRPHQGVAKDIRDEVIAAFRRYVPESAPLTVSEIWVEDMGIEPDPQVAAVHGRMVIAARIEE